ncbi:MAG TPA: hypothetical protein ENN21_07200 [Spirochaetes bacterium]|nr:hypothetical protein [Spirochaetota bacterium]
METRSGATQRKIPRIDLTDVLTALAQEIVLRCPSFSHCDLSKITLCLGSNRSGRGAIYGKLVPLRFRGGAASLGYRGKTYTMPVVMRNGVEQRYIIYFYYPRFFDLSPLEKLRVLFHELYHISPDFNGDIRRMAPVKASHGGSRKGFDRNFQEELALFHAHISSTPYMKFLAMDAAALHRAFKKVTGTRMKTPRPVVTGVPQKV